MAIKWLDEPKSSSRPTGIRWLDPLASLESFGFEEEESDRLPPRGTPYPADYFTNPPELPPIRQEMRASPGAEFLPEGDELPGKFSGAFQAGLLGLRSTWNRLQGSVAEDQGMLERAQELRQRAEDQTAAAQLLRTMTANRGAPVVSPVFDQDVAGALYSLPSMAFPGVGTFDLLRQDNVNRMLSEEYEAALEQTKSPEAARRHVENVRESVRGHSAASAGLQTAFEMFPPLRFAGRAIRGAAGALLNAGQTALEEGVSEALGGASSELYDLGVRGRDIGTFEEFVQRRGGDFRAGVIAGGTLAGAGSPLSVRRQRDVPAVETGDPDIDAGAQAAAEAQAQAGVDIAPAARTPVPTEQVDMFTRTGESQMVGDLLGGEPTLGSDIVRNQQLREDAEARDADGNLINPELNRLQDETTDLERDYIFTMQERLDNLRAERENLIRNGQPVEANNQRIENLVNDWARTGERNPAIADAFARAGLRRTTGLLEDTGFDVQQFFPSLREGEVSGEVPSVFQPTRPETVEQTAEQPGLDFQFRDVGQRTVRTEGPQGLLDLPMPAGPSVSPSEATQPSGATQGTPEATRAQRAVESVPAPATRTERTQLKNAIEALRARVTEANKPVDGIVADGGVDLSTLSESERAAIEAWQARLAEQQANQELDSETARLGRESAARSAAESGLVDSVAGQQEATGITPVWAETVDDLVDIVSPEGLQELRKDTGTRALAGAGSPRGLYIPGAWTADGNPRVVLFPSATKTPEQTAFTFAHEVAGHHGLRALAGNQQSALAALLESANGNEVVRKVAESMANRRKSTDALGMVEEALADLAAANRTGNWAKIESDHGVKVPRSMRGGIRSIIDSVVNFVKQLFGGGDRFSNRQVYKLLENAWKKAQEGGNQTAQDTRSPAFDTGDARTPAETLLAGDTSFTPSRSIARRALRLFEELVIPGRVIGSRGKENKAAMRDARDLMEGAKGLKLTSNQTGHTTKVRLERAIAASGVSMAQVREAMATRDFSKLPEGVREVAREFRRETDNLRLRIVDEILNYKPLENMTDAEAATLNKIAENDDYFTRVYMMDMEPQYANRIANRVARGTGTETDVNLVNRVVDDIKRMLIIPENLADLVESGKIDKRRLNDLYGARIGPDADKKSAETLVAELNQLRELQEAADYDQTVKSIFANLADPRADQSPIGRYFRGARADLGITMARENVPKSFREFWGEIDPNERLPLASALTIQKMSHLADTLKNLRYAEEIGRRNGWVSDRAKPGYKELKGDTFGALKGKFVPEDAAEIMEQQIIASRTAINQLDALLTDDPTFYTTAAAGQAARVVSRLTGAVKYNQVILKLGSWLVNGPGNISVLLANGNIPLLNGTKGFQGLGRGVRGVSGSVGASFREQMNEATDILVRNNLLQSPTVSDINSALRKEVVQEVYSQEGSGMKSIAGLLEATRKGALTVGEAYAVLDLWATGTGFFKNMDDLKSHWDKTGRQYTQADLEFEAARLTRSTNFNWSMVPKLVQVLEKGGFTQFGVYFVDTYRVLANNLLVGLEQVAEGVKTGDLNYVRVGAARVAGVSAATQFNPLLAAGLSTLGATVLSMGDEEDERKADAIVANNDFVNQPHLVKVGEKPDGTELFFDIGRLDAIEPASNSVYALLNGGDVSKSIGDLIFASTIWRRLYSSMFDDPTRVQSKLRNRAPELFAQVTQGERGRAAAVSLGEIFMPSFVSDAVVTRARAIAEGDDFTAIQRAASSAGLMLTEYHPLRSIGGDRGYASRFNRNVSMAWRDLSNQLGAPRDIPEDQVRLLYTRFRAQQEQAKTEIATAIEAAKQSGYSTRQIAAALEEGGVSKQDALTIARNPARYNKTVSDAFLQNTAEREALRVGGTRQQRREIGRQYEERRRLLRRIAREAQREDAR